MAVGKKTFDSKISANCVIERRFLTDGNEVYGYVSGIALENLAGVSTQVPNTVDITTNHTEENGIRTCVGGRYVRLCIPLVLITSENMRILQFLDLMSNVNVDRTYGSGRFLFEDFIRNLHLKLKDISAYINLFPSKTMKNIERSGVVDIFENSMLASSNMSLEN